MVLVGAATILAVAQVGSLFSADAWNNVTFTAGEVRNPSRNVPLSLALGAGAVLTMYILANFAYLKVLPFHGDPRGATVLARGIQYAQEDRVATAVLEQILHSGGAYLMAAAILVSTFGCANGMTLAGARVYYAMSHDGLFFKAAGTLHPRTKAPVASLVVQGIWTALLCISGSYRPVVGLYDFRRTHFLYPDHRERIRVAQAPPGCSCRPYRAFGYPVIARTVHCNGDLDIRNLIALQTAVHLARPCYRALWHSSIFCLVELEPHFTAPLVHVYWPSLGVLPALTSTETLDNGGGQLCRSLHGSFWD